MRVAGRPRVVAKGAVRPTRDFVEQRQVTRIGGLVDDDFVVLFCLRRIDGGPIC